MPAKLIANIIFLIATSVSAVMFCRSLAIHCTLISLFFHAIHKHSYKHISVLTTCTFFFFFFFFEGLYFQETFMYVWAGFHH